MILGGCVLLPPSLSGWTMTLIYHGGLLGLIGVPLGVLLKILPPSFRRYVALVMGSLIAVFVHIFIRYQKSNHPEMMTWMSAFVASTFGFAVFFKSLAVADGTYPDGANRDMHSWLLWFISVPEPKFAKGKLLKPSLRDLLDQTAFLVMKIVLLGGIFSVIIHYPEYRVFSSMENNSSWSSVAYILDSLVHLWLLYLFLSFCTEFSAMSMLLQGCVAQPGFLNPLLASRSFREGWGERWNMPVHIFLKKHVYIPFRKSNWSRSSAAMAAFVASGLLHEYTFSIHNTISHKPGHAVAFFLLMGSFMLVENAIWTIQWYRNLLPWDKIPTIVIAMGLQLLFAPAFEYFFIKQWFEAGMVESVSVLMPRLVCIQN